jgi:hypothetical protein
LNGLEGSSSGLERRLHVAVVIPVAVWQPRLPRCLAACAALTYEPRTIIVVSDTPIAMPQDPHFFNFVTNAGLVTGPGAKRDFARVAYPDADVYAYLDDDAFPPPQWLDTAVRVLAENPSAAGVAGPGLIPDDQTYWERVSAAVMEMYAGSGPLRFRFRRERPRDCDDFPAYDLFIRKERLDAAGGWATNWYGGEDSVLCARLAAQGGLIHYDPSLAVYHYRRRLIPEHAWQVWNVGRSRGCLIRAGDALSRRAVFAGPACFVALAAALLIAPFALGAPVTVACALIAAAYLAIVCLAPRRTPPLERLMTPFALLVHHGAYALGMAFGILTGTRTVRGGAAALADQPLSGLGHGPGGIDGWTLPQAGPAVHEAPTKSAQGPA